MARFDRILIADWSAASAPSPARPSPDAIWIGQDTGESRYFRTRIAAEAYLQAEIAATMQAGKTALIGFDFPFAYPAGFAAKLTGRAEAVAVWAYLAAHITDGPRNANNRFAVANGMNAAVAAPAFWGRPAHLNLAHLPARKAATYAALPFAERRGVERALPRTQPVWKLFTTGAAGSQGLMGQPMLHRLAQNPRVSVWPFAPPKEVTLAEVYPSLLASAVARDLAQSPSAIKDDVQVRLLARALHTAPLDLWAEMLHPKSADITEEGWILGAGHGAALEALL